jgi:hypothetical protein
MTVPVPEWPGLGAYPGSVLTTTILTMSPEMVEPDLLTWLETRTPMKEGSEAGGFPLFPGPAFHISPQDGGVLVLEAKPLKLSGAAPPLRELSRDQLALQKVTVVPLALLLSPITKAPLAGKAKISVVVLAEEGR